MARDYGRVSTRFWNSQDIRALSDRGKLLANYLLTGPHSNSIGAYLLPDAYIADDLGWSAETVSKALSELFEKGFCERFSDGRHIVVCKFLDWNPIENPNVGKGALKQLEQLPDDPVLHHVLDGLQQYEKHFPDGFGTVLERLQNIEPNLTEPNPEPKPKAARAVRAAVSQSLPDWIPQEPWKAYVEMRKKIKSPLTDRALELEIRKLETLKAQGFDPGAVLDQSTMKTWRGLFPLKADNIVPPANAGPDQALAAAQRLEREAINKTLANAEGNA